VEPRTGKIANDEKERKVIPSNQILHCKAKIVAIVRFAADIMGMINVQISLPDALAQEAQRAGLLHSETRLAVAQVDRLQGARAKLAADPLPAMSAEEIRAEIESYRAEKQRAAGR
jgi:hypothetical protein